MLYKSFLFLLPLSLLCGCARVEYVEVLVPQKCNVAKRERPKQSFDMGKDVKNVLIYTQMLEVDIKKCRGEK